MVIVRFQRFTRFATLASLVAAPACGDVPLDGDGDASSTGSSGGQTSVAEGGGSGEGSASVTGGFTTGELTSGATTQMSSTGSTGTAGSTGFIGSTSAAATFGMTPVGEESSSGTTGGDGSTTGSDGLLGCPAAEFSGATLWETNTAAQDDAFGGSCGGSGAPDVAVTFTAPEAGAYTFDTHGSAIDTVLYVLDGACGGLELGCNDDYPGFDAQSLVSVDLAQGQTVTVVADGFGVVGGAVTLGIRDGNVACPVESLTGPLPLTVQGATHIAGNEFNPTCGGGSTGQDMAYEFTAPEDGVYLFDTAGSDFDTMLSVLDGSCGGATLACNDQGAGISPASAVFAPLVAGQTVTAVVDGYYSASGNFSLNIDMLTGACPDVVLGDTLPLSVTGTTQGADNTAGASCGGMTSPDQLYSFTAPADGAYVFDTIGSSFSTVLYLLDESCGGDQLACNEGGAGSGQSRLVSLLEAGQTVIVGVDGDGQSGDFTLNVDTFPSCPLDTLSGPLPQQVTGNTANAINQFSPTCGGGTTGRDASYLFTAPEDGTYLIDTEGSSFNTVLSVLDGTCGGDVLACNQDMTGISPQSGLQVNLVAGQTVTVVVDGSYSASGDYALSISQAGGVCPDDDLGNVVPANVTGVTTGAGDTFWGSCGGFGTEDVSFSFTAPADGSYVFDSAGSDFDTVVYVLDGTCGGDQLACNDSNGSAAEGRAIVELSAGQTVTVVVDGDGETGTYALLVDEINDCCFSNGSTGCSVPTIEACVCGLDSWCCNNNWDSLCANRAINECGAVCS